MGEIAKIWRIFRRRRGGKFTSLDLESAPKPQHRDEKDGLEAEKSAAAAAPHRVKLRRHFVVQIGAGDVRDGGLDAKLLISITPYR